MTICSPLGACVIEDTIYMVWHQIGRQSFWVPILASVPFQPSDLRQVVSLLCASKASATNGDANPLPSQGAVNTACENVCPCVQSLLLGLARAPHPVRVADTSVIAVIAMRTVPCSSPCL